MSMNSRPFRLYAVLIYDGMGYIVYLECKSF